MQAEHPESAGGSFNMKISKSPDRPATDLISRNRRSAAGMHADKIRESSHGPAASLSGGVMPFASFVISICTFECSTNMVPDSLLVRVLYFVTCKARVRL